MLRVFQADASDLKWMYHLIINASNKGHFLLHNNRNGRDWQKRNLASIVLNNIRLDGHLQSQVLVYEKDSEKVGFVIMSEIEEGHGNEIYTFIVDNTFRGKGYGWHMLNDVIERWHSRTTIYARCLPSSEQMAGMLKKSGFVPEGNNEAGATIYRLDKKILTIAC